MIADDDQVVSFEGVSKFYGDVLGVDRVTLSIPAGITSVVGPNGAGKSTLLNLMTGLLLPSRGRVRVLGVPVSDPERFFRLLGYCAQFDHLPRGATGRSFIYDILRLHGLDHRAALEGTEEALERVGMGEAADRKMAAYSKGMRQRVRLAQSIAHHPRVLVLDEPLNGLDPMARAEVMDLLRKLAAQGMHVIVSSHILHEVDSLSDRVILLSHGYVVAEGQIHGVRGEVEDQPMQILVRCSQPSRLARLAFEQEHVVEAKIQSDSQGLLVRTRSADRFYALLNRAVVHEGIDVQAVVPADDDVGSVYQYLIGSEGGPS
jgi:ABC-2 type transport system ATP-binding protein